jgi:hypothetical protein
MPAVKKSNSAASKGVVNTPSVYQMLGFIFSFSDLNLSSRPRGRPPTKKVVKSSEFVDDEADEV